MAPEFRTRVAITKSQAGVIDYQSNDFFEQNGPNFCSKIAPTFYDQFFKKRMTSMRTYKVGIELRNGAITENEHGGPINYVVREDGVTRLP